MSNGIDFGKTAALRATNMAETALKNMLAVISDEEAALVAQGLGYLPAEQIRALFSQLSIPEESRHGLALRTLLPAGITLMEGGSALFLMAYSGWKDGAEHAALNVDGSRFMSADLLKRVMQQITKAGNTVTNHFLLYAKALGRKWAWAVAGEEQLSAGAEGAARVDLAPIEGHAAANPGTGDDINALDAELPK